MITTAVNKSDEDEQNNLQMSVSCLVKMFKKRLSIFQNTSHFLFGIKYMYPIVNSNQIIN